MPTIPGIGELGNLIAPASKAGTILIWSFVSLLGVLVIAAIIYTVHLHYKRYYIKTIILSKRSGGGGGTSEETMKTYIDKAGIFKYKNSEVFRIRGRKKNYPIPNLGYIYPDNTIYFVETTMDDLQPIRFPMITNPKVETQSADQDMKLWHAMENERWEAELKKKNFWDKYGAQIMLIFMAGVFLVIVIVLTKFLGQIADKLAATAASNAQVIASQGAATPIPTSPY